MARKKIEPEEIKAIEDTEGEIFPFKVIQGGRVAADGNEPPEDNTWLSRLPVNTYFYVKDNIDPWNYVASCFYIIDKMPGITTLEYQSSKEKSEVDVINRIFCKKYSLEYIKGRYIEDK